MNTNRKRATIDDVAQLAGVSIKTVSRVLNHEPRVSESTRERVNGAMETLKYRPNSSARRLAGNCSYILGLLYDNPSASYITRVQEGVLEASKAEHYDILIYPCNRNDPAFLDDVAEMAAGGRVDGLILTSPITGIKGLRMMMDELQVPCVVISVPDDSEYRWTVGTNDREVCAEMVRHLAGLGHKKIAFVLGHPDHTVLLQRFEGYKDGMNACGLEVAEDHCLQGFNTFESGVENARQLLEKQNPPTAIFCANDDMAAGVLKVAHEMGIRVPHDLSVAGFDDHPLASQCCPALTTVRQPTHEMARLATELLIKRLRRQVSESVKKDLASTLVIRDSTGAVPIA